MDTQTALETLQAAVTRLEGFERRRGAHHNMKPQDALNTIKELSFRHETLLSVINRDTEGLWEEALEMRRREGT